jgi:hypothetical protein
MKDKLPDWEDAIHAGANPREECDRLWAEKWAEKPKHNGKVIQLQVESAKHVKQREQKNKPEAEAIAPAPPAELIDGAKLLDEALAFYRRFVAYPSEHAAIAHVIWTVHTHLMECWETSPRLAFMSAEKRSGKTRAMELTALLVHNPLPAINASAQAVVRSIDAERCTILHDEIDSIYGNRQRR